MQVRPFTPLINKDKKPLPPTGWLEFLPSLGWVSFMVIPLAAGLTSPTSPIASIQWFGVLLVTFVFLLADARVFCLGKRPQAPRWISGWENRIFFLALFATILLAGLETIFVEPKPLLVGMLGADKMTLAQSREFFEIGRGGWTMSRILNPAFLILGMILFSWLIWRKHYAWAAVSFISIGLLQALSSAKAPVLIYGLSCFIFLALFRRNRWLQGVLGLMILLPLFSLAGVLFFRLEAHPLYSQMSQEERSELSFSVDGCDEYRILRDSKKLTETSLTYFFYRTIFVPVCVSARWYEFQVLLPAEDRIERVASAFGLANAVGRWAYAERFPENYLPHVRAYASLDADAFARFSVWGIWVVAGLYAIARIGVFLGLQGSNPLQQGLYALAISLLFCVPWQGSFQALLGPQGLCLILCLGLIHRRLAWRSIGAVQNIQTPDPRT
jgi:hypothetical protein